MTANDCPTVSAAVNPETACVEGEVTDPAAERRKLAAGLINIELDLSVLCSEINYPSRLASVSRALISLSERMVELAKQATVLAERSEP